MGDSDNSEKAVGYATITMTDKLGNKYTATCSASGGGTTIIDAKCATMQAVSDASADCISSMLKQFRPLGELSISTDNWIG